MPFYVNVYLTNRAWGGPEEGSWWYDTGEPVRALPTYTREKAERVLRAAEAICARWNQREGRREPSSVLCDGYYAAASSGRRRRVTRTSGPHMNEAFQAIIDKHKACMAELRETFERQGYLFAVSQRDPSYKHFAHAER